MNERKTSIYCMKLTSADIIVWKEISPILDTLFIGLQFSNHLLFRQKKASPTFLLQIPVLKFPKNIHDQTRKDLAL